MNSHEKFNQFMEVSNSIGPISDPIKEVYVFVSRQNGLEGVMSLSMSEHPVVLQAVTSNKDSVGILEEAIKQQVQLPEGCTVHLCKFVLAEEVRQVL